MFKITVEQVRNQLIWDGLRGYSADQHAVLHRWIADWLTKVGEPRADGRSPRRRSLRKAASIKNPTAVENGK
jgi:hypothetical protein